MVQEQIFKLPHATDDLWRTLMALDDNFKEESKGKEPKEIGENTHVERYPVSRFGALLAISILNLPEETEYPIIEEYFPRQP